VKADEALGPREPPANRPMRRLDVLVATIAWWPRSPAHPATYRGAPNSSASPRRPRRCSRLSARRRERRCARSPRPPRGGARLAPPVPPPQRVRRRVPPVARAPPPQRRRPRSPAPSVRCPLPLSITGPAHTRPSYLSTSGSRRGTRVSASGRPRGRSPARGSRGARDTTGLAGYAGAPTASGGRRRRRSSTSASHSRSA
jgi:hypothetical protein